MALNTPFCGDLRSKKYVTLGVLAQSAADYIDDSFHVWCYHTQQPFGPDGKYVVPERCVPGRSCYRSALAEPKK
jgi:hypothetical protein